MTALFSKMLYIFIAYLARLVQGGGVCAGKFFKLKFTHSCIYFICQNMIYKRKFFKLKLTHSCIYFICQGMIERISYRYILEILVIIAGRLYIEKITCAKRKEERKSLKVYMLKVI